MKKLILLLVMTMGISMGCDRVLSTSQKPTVFTIIKTSQTCQDKQAGVTQYKLQKWTFLSDGSRVLSSSNWYTLQEGFQVGDTLRFMKY